MGTRLLHGEYENGNRQDTNVLIITIIIIKYDVMSY